MTFHQAYFSNKLLNWDQPKRSYIRCNNRSTRLINKQFWQPRIDRISRLRHQSIPWKSDQTTSALLSGPLCTIRLRSDDGQWGFWESNPLVRSSRYHDCSLRWGTWTSCRPSGGRWSCWRCATPGWASTRRGSTCSPMGEERVSTRWRRRASRRSTQSAWTPSRTPTGKLL